MLDDKTKKIFENNSNFFSRHKVTSKKTMKSDGNVSNTLGNNIKKIVNLAFPL